MISLLTALALLAPGGSAAQTGAQEPFFGVNAQGVFPYHAQAQWPTHMNAISASGIGLVRFDAAWNTIEPKPPSGAAHRFDWRFYDAAVGAMARAGLRWYPILDYSAAWAAVKPGNVKSPPASVDTYAAFAAGVAWRYGRDGSFWRDHPELPSLPVMSYEIWNEENSSYFWQPEPDPAAYANLYIAAREAIKGQDPGARVVVGGLVPARGAAAFLAGMLEARPDARGAIDAVAIHPYAQTPQQVANVVLGMRSALTRLGLGDVPLEITEVGWTTSGPGAVTDSVRAANFKWLMDWVTTCGCGVTRFIAHTWATKEQQPNNREDWFGLYHPNGEPTQSGVAFGETVRRLTAGTPDPAPPADGHDSGPVGAPPALQDASVPPVTRNVWISPPPTEPVPGPPPGAPGSGACIVPKVSGLRLASARKRVRSVGCRATARRVLTRRYARGRVVRASARPGARLERHSVVELVVAGRVAARPS
jgi:hypothetical protein